MVLALMGIRLCLNQGNSLHVYLTEDTFESQLTILKCKSSSVEKRRQFRYSFAGKSNTDASARANVSSSWTNR